MDEILSSLEEEVLDNLGAVCKEGRLGRSDDDAGHGFDSSSKRKKKKAAPRGSNSDYCRRYREKKKQMQDQLKWRHEELTTERDIYLRRIAELQAQVEALRHEGSVDLEKENELLRAEVLKHRQFLQSLIDTLKNLPDTKEDEKIRLLQNGIDSMIGQSLGMAHTSLTWKDLKPLIIDQDHVIQGKFQYLPLGCQSKDAKRVNIRNTEVFRNVSPAKAMGRFFNFFQSFEAINEYLQRSFPDEVKREVESFLLPMDWTFAMKSMTGDLIQGFKYKEAKDEQEVVGFALISLCNRRAQPRIFVDENLRTEVPEGEVECTFVTVTIGHSTLEQMGLINMQEEENDASDARNKKILREHVLESFILIPHATSKEAFVMTTLVALPLGTLAFGAFIDDEKKCFSRQAAFSFEQNYRDITSTLYFRP